jgi:class 3 adenylate cyclase
MLRTTVIVKTDLVKSTEYIRGLTGVELDRLLAAHAELFKPIVTRYHGAILKGEGDAFWLTFPSVTAGALAAIDMQRALRHSQSGVPEPLRLAMRIAIALGDVLHRDDDLFGSAMALTARIESQTPTDEIYLSHSAWLALNHAEVDTVFVSAIELKGFAQPEPVYRVVQRDLIRLESNQVVVVSDIQHFARFVAEKTIDDIANALTQYEALAQIHLNPAGGNLRVMAGDNFLITFSDPAQALPAVEAWVKAWVAFIRDQGYDLPIYVGIEQGPYYFFRAHLFGSTINNAFGLVRSVSDICPTDTGAVLVSKAVYAALCETEDGQRLAASLNPIPADHPDKPEQAEIYQLPLAFP